MNTASEQAWPRPEKPRPVVIIGAGGIVHDAHLPAYRRLGLEVVGLFDLDQQRAEKLAAQFDVATVYPSLEQATARSDVCYPDTESDVEYPCGCVFSRQ